MKKHPDEMILADFNIDTSCYPWLAYKGPRWRPTENHDCYTTEESKLLRECDTLREHALNRAGYFLRDDRLIREAIEAFTGFEEAYSLHTSDPFERHAVFAGRRTWAIDEAYKHVFGVNACGPTS